MIRGFFFLTLFLGILGIVPLIIYLAGTAWWKALLGGGAIDLGFIFIGLIIDPPGQDPCRNRPGYNGDIPIGLIDQTQHKHRH